MSSNLFKLRVYLLELLLILFVDSYLMVYKLFQKIFKVGFRLVGIEGLLLNGKSRWVLGFGVWVELGV